MKIGSSVCAPPNRWLEKISPAVRFVWRGKWPAGQVEPMRFLYDHELVIVSQGECQLTLNGHSQVFTAPSFFIVPPGVAHESKAQTEIFRDCIHFDWVAGPSQTAPLWTYLPASLRTASVRSAPREIPPHFFHGTLSDAPRVMSLIASLRLRWNQISDADRLGARAILLDVLGLLLAQGEAPARDYSTRLAEQIKSLLERNLLSTDSVSEMLAPLGISSAHLSRVFKNVYQMTPVSYLISLRLERARQLLREGRLSVAEAARASGFSDVSYFGRLFRKHEGHSPRDYRFRA